MPKKDIQLTDPQKEIIKNKSRFRVANCGRRFGKTFTAEQEIKACATSPAPDDGHKVYERRVLYMAPQKNQAVDIMWEPLKKSLMGTAVFVDKSEKKNTIEVKIDKDYRKGEDVDTGLIKIGGWNKVDNIRGQAWDLIILDEVSRMKNFGSGWNGAIKPMLIDKGGDVLFISTPKGYNHFYDLFEEAGDESDKGREYLPKGEAARFHFTTYDNPHIDEEEIEMIKSGTPETKFAQEFLGEFKKMEGLVYPQFKRERHVVDETPETFAEVIAGVDFGYTNPTAIPIIGVDQDRNYWVKDEVYQTGLTGGEIAQIAKEKSNSHNIRYFYPDPEAPAKIKDLRNEGLNCRSIEKDLGYIDNLREIIKSNRFFVHKSCVNTINEFEQYKYPEQRRDKNKKEKPKKKNDHLMDALRYSITHYEPKGGAKPKKNKNPLDRMLNNSGGSKQFTGTRWE